MQTKTICPKCHKVFNIADTYGTAELKPPVADFLGEDHVVCEDCQIAFNPYMAGNRVNEDGTIPE